MKIMRKRMGRVMQSFMQRIWGLLGIEDTTIKKDSHQAQPEKWSAEKENSPFYASEDNCVTSQPVKREIKRRGPRGKYNKRVQNTSEHQKYVIACTRAIDDKKTTIEEVERETPFHHIPKDFSFGHLVKYHRLKNKWNVSGFLKRLKIDNLPLRFVRSVEEYGFIPDPKTVERMAYVLGAPRKEMIKAAYKQILDDK